MIACLQMSLRNPKIAEDITKEIGMYITILTNLISLADAQIQKDYRTSMLFHPLISDFLSDILNNMQMSLSGMGAGEPKPGSGQGMVARY
jgi:hypothetical protein